MRLIPNYSNQSNSSAEDKLLELFRNCDDLDGWVCFHSLGLSRHISKREAEIDFLLIGPPGIFVLEVKGGRVERRNGIWAFMNRFNHVSTKKESPFKQAQSAHYSLMSDLQENVDEQLKEITSGYGVVFADIDFSEDSPEWSQEIICNKRNFKQPISEYIHRLTDYWHGRGRHNRQLTKRQISDLASYLRGDFEIVVTLADRSASSEEQIARLTKEQTKYLDVASDNPRIVLSGAAGTGKTMLAVETLKRKCIAGDRVLFLCYNRLLAGHLKGLLGEQLNEYEESEYIVDNLHAFIRQHIDITNEQITAVSDKKDLFNNQFPDKFLETIKSEPIEKFDYLIVDEAQDVLSDKYIQVLSSVVKGGLENGNWLMCMDPENQNIYDGDTNTLLNTIKKKATTLKLSINCRNTISIAHQTELVTGIRISTGDGVQGIPVQYVWYDDVEDQAQKISDLIKKLTADGLSEKDIVILSPNRGSRSLVGSGSLPASHEFYEIQSEHLATLEDQPGIGYTTIHAYKGLEKKVIILTDIEGIYAADHNLLNYIGFTRARSLLVASIRKDQRINYQTRLKGFGK